MIIYKAINQVNGKVYIGQTIRTLQDRKRDHIREANKDCGFYFHSAIRKHGADNFYWMVLNECDDIDILNQLEEYYIKCYESTNSEYGYNLENGGKNRVMSDYTRQKMSDNHADVSGENNPMYGVRMFGEDNPMFGADRGGEKHPMFGRNQTQETKDLISKSRIESGVARGENNPMYGVHRYGKDNPMYGVHYCGEDNHNYGRRNTPEQKERMSKARYKYLAKKREQNLAFSQQSENVTEQTA